MKKTGTAVHVAFSDVRVKFKRSADFLGNSIIRVKYFITGSDTISDEPESTMSVERFEELFITQK